MTPQRAQEILDTARNSEGFGPWVDRIKVTPVENEYVQSAWNKLHGNSNFVDALRAVAEGRVDPFTYYNAGGALGVVGVLLGHHVEEGQYTWLSARNPAFTWVRTADLHATREAAAAAPIARFR